MIHRFATYEQAALFAARKRSDGYQAEVLNDNASLFWGSLTIGEVMVRVSEEAAEEGQQVPEMEGRPFRLPDELSKLVGGLVPAVCAAYLIWIAFQGALLFFVILAGLLGLLVLFFAALGLGLLPWLRAMRNPESRHHEWAMAVAGFLATLLALTILLCGGGNVGLGG